MTTNHAVRGDTALPKRATVTGVLAAAGSVLAVLGVAAIGKAAGASATQLSAGSLIFLTVIGVTAGTLAWTLILRRAKAPAQLLARLVPVVLILSFIPDILLGVSGTAWSAVAVLMVAHVAVFAVTIPLLIIRLRPPR